MNRKKLALNNIGGRLTDAQTSFFSGGEAAQGKTNIVLVERMLLQLLRGEIDRFADTDNSDLFRRFMSHFFDPLAGAETREKFVANFQAKPPLVILNYPRQSTEMPCIAVVLENESEEQNFVGDEIGATLGDETTQHTASFHGSYWQSTYGLYIYANHPDVCVYLYHMVKMILFGAKLALESGGFFNVTFSGTELIPDDSLIPENVFMRTLRITGTSQISIPEFVPDPAKIRIAAYRDDVIVDGLRGGVGTYAFGEESDADE